MHHTDVETHGPKVSHAISMRRLSQHRDGWLTGTATTSRVIFRPLFVPFCSPTPLEALHLGEAGDGRVRVRLCCCFALVAMLHPTTLTVALVHK